MTHYTCLVVTQNGTEREVEKALAPFDENIEVAPRWEDSGNPIDMHHAFSVRDKDRNHIPGAWEIAPWAVLVGDTSWDVSDLETLMGDKERSVYKVSGGTVWELTTYSPASKWDWYKVGGRWNNELLCQGVPTNSCRVKDLSIHALRIKARLRACAEFDDLAAAVTRLGSFTPWSEFIKLVDSGDLDIDVARDAFHDQPHLREEIGLDKHSVYMSTLSERRMSRDEYLDHAVKRALPGWAVLTLDGEWREPGKMGWFAMNSATDESEKSFYDWKSAYFDELSRTAPDAWVTLMDLHI